MRHCLERKCRPLSVPSLYQDWDFLGCQNILGDFFFFTVISLPLIYTRLVPLFFSILTVFLPFEDLSPVRRGTRRLTSLPDLRVVRHQPPLSQTF